METSQKEARDLAEIMRDEAIATLAERYLVEESQVQALARQVRSSQLEHRERIAMLLETGGVAASLRTSLADGSGYLPTSNQEERVFGYLRTGP